MRSHEKGEVFELPIDYKGTERMISCQLAPMGYTYKIYAEADGYEIIFEPDEERNFRAVMEDVDAVSKVDIQLVRDIGVALEKHLR